jgi:thiamine-monophosphate kinase
MQAIARYMMQIGQLGEFELVERLLAQVDEGGAGLVLGPGDDAAAITPTPGMLLIATCDSQVEGQHFRLGQGSPEQLGRRLAAVNLSDIAAMGGRPRWSLVSLCLPIATEAQFLEQLYRGIASELRPFETQVIGGNVARSDRLALDMTLLGEIASDQMLKRSGAMPGDAVLVTGSLGASAAGRAILDSGGAQTPAEQVVADKHLVPEPRVVAGRAIAESRFAHAMIDISDGFLQDLGHICTASACGVEIDATAIPTSAEAQQAADRLRQNALEWALSGGEDYELILTAPNEHVSELVRTVTVKSGVTVTRVGTLLNQAEGRWLIHKGQRTPLSSIGWEHFGPHAGGR